jgi:pSer/pThr/pTyr-binding forkhead associated (FHA) protein
VIEATLLSRVHCQLSTRPSRRQSPSFNAIHSTRVSLTYVPFVLLRSSTTTSQLVVEDLKSTNGTYVNDTRVECIALNDGDCLRLGRVDN